MKPVYIIAEAGVNHNGSPELAKKLVDVAIDSGANAVKFQTFRAENLVSASVGKAAYQVRNTGNDGSQFEMLKGLELSREAHHELFDYCAAKGIQFLSSPFDVESLRFLVSEFDLPLIKIPSGEITNAELLLEAGKTGKKVVLSTGMSTLGEIENALGVLAFGYFYPDGHPSFRSFREILMKRAARKLLKERVIILHCLTEYPAPVDQVNLNAMVSLQQAFGVDVGYSDHTIGVEVSLAAVALGAIVIEKHFTTDKNLPGPDHKASLKPEELKFLVRSIRNIEKALGDSWKTPVSSEIANISVARKSLYAAKEIKKGEIFTRSNLTSKRPGTGMSPIRYWDLIGRQAELSYNTDDQISENLSC